MSSIEQTSSISLQNTRISLSEAGKGENVLCLHGNPGSKKIFSEMMTKLEGTNLKLLSLDRPGHNSTEELLGDKNNIWHDTSVYAELIDAKLDSKAWLLGHSYGCLNAIKIAIKHPEKVKGLILINPEIVPNNPKEKISKIPDWAKGAFLGTIFGVWLPNEYQQVFSEQLEKMYAPEKPSEDFKEKWLQKFTRFESIIAYLLDRNIQVKIQSELSQLLPGISLPTYTLFGGKDELSDLNRQKEAVALIPNAKIEINEEAGHYMPLNNTEACIKFVTDCCK